MFLLFLFNCYCLCCLFIGLCFTGSSGTSGLPAVKAQDKYIIIHIYIYIHIYVVVFVFVVVSVVRVWFVGLLCS